MAAASLATTQCFANSMFLLSSTRGATHQRLVGVGQVPSRTRRVACQAEGGSSRPNSSQIPTPPPPPPSPKVSTKLIDVLAFSGPAPERINGRLAMIGFVTALAVEAASGNDLVAQLSSGGTPWFLWVSGLLSAASLVPLFQGVSVESKSSGVMSSKAEMWNGRAAMLGLVALVLTEYLKGGPLV